MKVGMISLGCSKNQVDSEMMLGLLLKSGFSLSLSLDESDLIIINTCAFIDAAKNEAIETIAEVINKKRKGQKIVVCGCFAERYKDFITYNFKDIDLVITLKDYPNFSSLISSFFEVKNDSLSFTSRLLISPSFSPYIRIADGCNNHCAFCAIPLIRGSYQSRKMEDIIDEASYLVKGGAKELNIIAQDTSKYGVDNYHKLMLPELLKKLSEIEGVYLIRIFYIYPETVTDELISVIKSHENIAPYFDIPLQHASNKVLSLMGRHFSKEKSISLIQKIKKEIPSSVIRTTLMVGFPGESNKDFKELIQFVKEMRFFHMGAFTYSREEGTKSYFMKKRVPEIIKRRRYDILMNTQRIISEDLKRDLVGKEFSAIIDSYDEESVSYNIRSYHFAPEGIDGSIIAFSSLLEKLNPGDIVIVKIVSSSEYDLYGNIERKISK
ncbi:MAG: 30S ribosomal protein S12 methylthiotransferase RimO [Bacillales bacterium]|nr:30S ribosomal protein S12 methylthiotransferase RimO [Bacillales bacterium]